METLIVERQYYLSELKLFQNPALTAVFAIMALIAIIWMFHRYWHRYCYTATGSSILVMTMISITVVIYIYVDNHIEYRNLCQELTLIEEELVRDFNYNIQ